MPGVHSDDEPLVREQVGGSSSSSKAQAKAPTTERAPASPVRKSKKGDDLEVEETTTIRAAGVQPKAAAATSSRGRGSKQTNKKDATSAGDPSSSSSDPVEEIELPKLPEAVFPATERLLPIHTGKDDLCMCDLEPYSTDAKRRENSPARAANGWSTAPKRSGGIEKRQSLISDILSRWWYVFPQWPAPDHDYSQALAKKGYREVPVANWTKEKDIDEEGLHKVYQLKQFPGIFRDANQIRMDMRPVKSCPCFLNLQAKPIDQLIKWLKRAYENQIMVLKTDACTGWGNREALVKDLQLSLKTLHSEEKGLLGKYGKRTDPYSRDIKKYLRKLHE
ncbi:unnamed protein product [Amoebophrya sp. A25]|nr:unnamed protein product [Amoebophrya sp. A25]|eukprot:GSA25T00008182001.1